MDKGLLTRILGFISIPIILRGIVSLIMREKEREMTYNLRKERIVIRPPKVIGWIAGNVVLHNCPPHHTSLSKWY